MGCWARILKWVDISSSGGSSWSRDQSWGQVMFPHQWIHKKIFQSVRLFRWEKLTINDDMLPTNTETPGQLKPKDWWCGLLLTSPPTHQKNSSLSLPWPLPPIPLTRNPVYKISSYSSGRVCSFQGISLLCSLFAWQRNKATLSFFISLSPYFCLSSLHRVLRFQNQISHWSHCFSTGDIMIEQRQEKSLLSWLYIPIQGTGNQEQIYNTVWIQCKS